MKVEQFMASCNAATKGSNIVLEWDRPAKTFKSCISEVRKAVRMVGRIGIDYNNISAVKAKRESGELPDEAQPIWKGAGEWAVFPFLIRHKTKGTHYARFYFGTSDKVCPKVQWYLDGNPVEFNVVESMLTAEEKRDDEKSECFTVCVENVLRIGNESDYSEESVEERAIAETA